jgi:KipI family sensor histidine kinase inhibitor
MEWRALGDSAWLCEPGGTNARHKLQRVLGVQAALKGHLIPEVDDIVVSFQSIAVYFDTAVGDTVLDWLVGLSRNFPASPSEPSHLIEVPVDYHDESSEREQVAGTLGVPPQDIISLHGSCDYEVAAIGFSPGFPYLSGLDPRLALPRKQTPRPVPAGAVAIADSQAGIYPFASQGGWHVLGRTDVLLFDPHASEPSLLKPGDRVRFVASRDMGKYYPPEQKSPSNVGIEVLEPGMCSTIQDLGRTGHRAFGVTRGGASDPVSTRVANRLVGNPDDAAVIECAGTGPMLKFDRPTIVAWLGWAEGAGKPHAFLTDDVLDLRSRMRFSRGIIAISGGIDVPFVLGSRSTDVRAGFGGLASRPLRAHDRIPPGKMLDHPPVSGAWHVDWPRPTHSLEVRFLNGMQSAWFSAGSNAALRNAIYQTTSTGDRTGMRLAGPKLQLQEPNDLVSQPVVSGSIQVPPDGVPIVLLSECQTIGGYPQIGHVISADLPALARALPGTPVTFREVSLDEARQAWRDLQRDLSLLHTGLSLLP